MQTLFAGGTLLYQQRAAEAAFDQAAAQYRSTVITAFQNVADTLYALQNDAESLKAAVAAERAAKVTLDLTLEQQQAGYANYLALLSAQQAYQQALITRVQAQANALPIRRRSSRPLAAAGGTAGTTRCKPLGHPPGAVRNENGKNGKRTPSTFCGR